jgi:hypothetical protein
MQAHAHKRDGRALLRLAKENPWAFFRVMEMVAITRLPHFEMTRLRKLADRSPEDNPWRGDFTRLDLFLDWYRGRRRELEKEYPGI